MKMIRFGENVFGCIFFGTQSKDYSFREKVFGGILFGEPSKENAFPRTRYSDYILFGKSSNEHPFTLRKFFLIEFVWGTKKGGYIPAQNLFAEFWLGNQPFVSTSKVLFGRILFV